MSAALLSIRGLDVYYGAVHALKGVDPRWPFALADGTPEWLGPIVSIVIGQLHALHLTKARGLDPERPRNLNKVTRTR